MLSWHVCHVCEKPVYLHTRLLTIFVITLRMLDGCHPLLTTNAFVRYAIFLNIVKLFPWNLVHFKTELQFYKLYSEIIIVTANLKEYAIAIMY